MELGPRHIKMLVAYADSPEGLGFNDVKKVTGLPGKTLAKKKEELKAEKLIKLHKEVGQKQYYQITKKALKYVTEHKIKTKYGLVGLKWAEETWKKGYKIRFLNDFTNLEGHDKLLLAWHPRTGDVRLAEIFGVGEFKATHYQGQYVDRKTNPNRPIRGPSTLQDFVKKNVNNFTNDQEVAKAVKKFYEEHNSFATVLLPKEEIRFGFPRKKEGKIQEIGRFNSLIFVGFQGTGVFPFIPKINVMTGGFIFSENFEVRLNYDLNIVALYNFVKLQIKEKIFPDSVDSLQIDEWQREAGLKDPIIKLRTACKNLEPNGYCKKMKINCIAFEEIDSKPHLNLKKCPILVNDINKLDQVETPSESASKNNEQKAGHHYAITFGSETSM